MCALFAVNCLNLPPVELLVRKQCQFYRGTNHLLANLQTLNDVPHLKVDPKFFKWLLKQSRWKQGWREICLDYMSR